MIEWIAIHGESYKSYIEWADHFSIPTHRRHKKSGFFAAVQRNRNLLRAARERIVQEVRAMGIATKEQRIALLWESVERLDRRIKNATALIDNMDPDDEIPARVWKARFDDLTKLEDQLRKTMETIAKEMGEFNKPPDESADEERAGIAEALARAGVLKQKTGPRMIQGQAREVVDDG